jgi:hypothetical protein
MKSTTVTTIQAVKRALSAARIGTYEAETGAVGMILLHWSCMLGMLRFQGHF